ncbi:MAG TPA: 7-cyano-7-deazaguanine synthase [Nitrososphaeraceae archaeon]|nr:7-cyano-7-deazaguanine synthase [Nitrososphaeraceae archaeon]
MENEKIAICIMSGGLDSLCAAAYVKNYKKYTIKIISFSYGQRAKREIIQSRKLAKTLNSDEYRTVDISFMKKLYGNSNVLTNSKFSIPSKFDHSIVVPIRNAIFITIATAWAFSVNADLIVLGAHADDFHYPDCRPKFIQSITNALNIGEEDKIKNGTRQKVSMWSPSLEGITKYELLKLGHKMLGDTIFESWSCYSNGKRIHKDMVQCGECESCINRKMAFSKAGIEDKTIYAKN